MKKISAYVFVAIWLWTACNPDNVQIKIEEQDSNTQALLQAISIVDQNTVWVSGHEATYARTLDGGETWESFQISEADSLQFRDIEAFDQDRVILMAAGPGENSQIRKTEDGGTNWATTYVMDIDSGFLDCIAFWDDQRGIAYGDAVGDGLFILKTEDGGTTWNRIDPKNLPIPDGNEGGFAASGTCVEVASNGLAWIGTGAGNSPRVLISTDYGNTWEVANTPVVAGSAAGITSINFWDEDSGIIVGGDLTQPNAYTNNVAVSIDGGSSWEIRPNPVTKGAFYGCDVISFKSRPIALACGPNGIDYSLDLGSTWTNLDTLNYWAIGIMNEGSGWAVGKNGRISKITIE